MRFVHETELQATPAEVFAFHERPGAFERLTPPWERVRVTSGGESIKPGARVELLLRIGPFWRVWIAEHVDYEPPHLFSDRQVKGPFAYWFHRHHFLPVEDGRTLLRDEIEFEPPLGLLGRWMLGGMMHAKLAKTFAYRHQVTKRAVEGTQNAAS